MQFRPLLGASLMAALPYLAFVPGASARDPHQSTRQLLQAKPSPVPPPSPAPSSSSNNNYVVGAAIGAAFGAVIVAVAFCAFLIWHCRKRRARKQEAQVPLANGYPEVYPAMAPSQPSSAQSTQGAPKIGTVQPPHSGDNLLVDVNTGSHMNDIYQIPVPPGPGPAPAATTRSPPPHVSIPPSLVAPPGFDRPHAPVPKVPRPPPGPQQAAVGRTSGEPRSNDRPGQQQASNGGTGSQPNSLSTLPVPNAGTGAGTVIVSCRELQRITGLEPGDPFLRNAAPSYKWCVQPLEKMIPVEEGVTAAAAAAQAILKSWKVPGSAPGPAPVQLSHQDVLDQIELLANGLIDRGGTAVVFKCRWPKRFGHNHVLAAKILPDPTKGYDQQQKLSSFKHEADVLMKCSHRNIVRLYGYCLEHPTICLIMELLPSSLKSRLYGSGWTKLPSFAANEHKQLGAHAMMMGPQRNLSLPSHQGAPMKMREVLLLSRDIAEGLAHLHAKVKTQSGSPAEDDDPDEEESPESLNRVVHRDLKPANILINTKGVAKISDFGLAREHLNSTGLDTNNPQMGTLRYMAPELISSTASAKLTSKVDMYSLAVLMWEMVARKVPWSECSDLQVPLQVYSGKRPQTPKYELPEDQNLDLTNYGPRSVAEMIAISGASLKSLPPADCVPDFHTFPQFTTIIHACWQQNPRIRPSAATVYKQLQLLVEAAGIKK